MALIIRIGIDDPIKQSVRSTLTRNTAWGQMICWQTGKISARKDICEATVIKKEKYLAA